MHLQSTYLYIPAFERISTHCVIIKSYRYFLAVLLQSNVLKGVWIQGDFTIAFLGCAQL